MSRLRNRMVKAEFWTDPDLLSWTRDKRFFYMGLRAAAEDSGCIEDSHFGWMLVLYPSPLDRDISIEQVTAWRDELIADGKLVRYRVAGKDYLYQATFHNHEHPRNPQGPNLPLPPWVTWTQSGKDARKGRYETSYEALPSSEASQLSLVQPLYKPCTTVVQGSPSSPALPCPALPCPAQSNGEQEEHLFTTAAVPAAATYPEDFEEWWETYGRHGGKADALKFWRHWTAHGAAPADLLTAGRNYVADCRRRGRLIWDGRTFLGKDPNRWAEWLEPQPAEIVQQRSGRAVDSALAAIGEVYRMEDS